MIANFNVDSRRFLQCSHGSPRCYTATAAYMYATAVSNRCIIIWAEHSSVLFPRHKIAIRQ